MRKTPSLEEGMTIAIEAIYNMGGPGVKYDGSDDWTIVSEDGSLAGLFERTILVGENGPELITYFPGEIIPQG
jgi:methionyl aminopeptidase